MIDKKGSKGQIGKNTKKTSSIASLLQKLPKTNTNESRTAASTVPPSVSTAPKTKNSDGSLGRLNKLQNALQKVSEDLQAKAQRREEEKQRQKAHSNSSGHLMARLMQQESQNFGKILEHPQFVKDPIAALTAHLAVAVPKLQRTQKKVSK